MYGAAENALLAASFLPAVITSQQVETGFCEALTGLYESVHLLLVLKIAVSEVRVPLILKIFTNPPEGIQQIYFAGPMSRYQIEQYEQQSDCSPTGVFAAGSDPSMKFDNKHFVMQALILAEIYEL